MSTDFYTYGDSLTAHTTARSADVKTELQAVETGLALLPTEKELKQGTINYAADTGVANAYVVVLPYVPAGYEAGLEVNFKAVNANTDASTINVNALGAVSLLQNDGTALVAGDIPAGGMITSRCDGTNLLLTSTQGGSVTASAASAAAAASSETNAALSATAAAGSATNAASSALAAASSETNSGTSETNAASSALAAASSETNSGTSETNAASSALAAASSETNSAASAVAAAASAAGFKWKDRVIVASTANLTLSGEQTIDGVTTSASRVLAKDQTAPTDNGIYVTAAGAWARATDNDAWDEFPGAVVVVEQGAVNADKLFLCTSDSGGTLGTTAVVWSDYGAGDVVGPAAATANSLARFDGTTGKLLKDGAVIGTDVQAYNALLADIAGLTVAAGDVFYGVGTNNVNNLAKGTDGEVLTLVSGLPAWAVSSGKLVTARATNTADIALAAQSAGGSQVLDFGVQTIPTAGFIRLSLIQVEYDETGGANVARASSALKVGTDALLWSAADDANGTLLYEPIFSANAGATGVIQNCNQAYSGSTLFTITFDIAVQTISTGSQNISMYFGDREAGTTGLITITGATYTTVGLLEIISL